MKRIKGKDIGRRVRRMMKMINYFLGLNVTYRHPLDVFFTSLCSNVRSDTKKYLKIILRKEYYNIEINVNIL